MPVMAVQKRSSFFPLIWKTSRERILHSPKPCVRSILKAYLLTEECSSLHGLAIRELSKLRFTIEGNSECPKDCLRALIVDNRVIEVRSLTSRISNGVSPEQIAMMDEVLQEGNEQTILDARGQFTLENLVV